MACLVSVALLVDPRAPEVFAETRSRTHETYRLRQAHLAFFRGRINLAGLQCSTPQRVVGQFRGPKGDQMRKGAVLSRVRGGMPRLVGAGDDAVYLMTELMSLLMSPSLNAYDTGNGR